MNLSTNIMQAPAKFPNEETQPTREQMKLKQTCREFEAVMMSLVMKEGLKGAEEIGKVDGQDEGDSGSKTFKEIAYEQMFYHVGKTGMLGIGDMLYDKLKDRLQETKE